MSSWARVAEALEQASEAGRTPSFWLRDDDAIRVTPALARLGEITRQAVVPIVLAVIPARADRDLAAWVRGQPDARVVVHGYAHANHAPPGAKKEELGSHRPLDAVRADLVAGFDRTRDLFGAQTLPMLVPPWNRIAPSVVQCLPELDFRILSAFGPARFSVEGLAILNTHVDLIDWHGTRGCRPHEDLLSEIVALLGQGGGSPIGILTHHLVHDEAAWAFLSELFEVTGGRARWTAPKPI
ncbi:MAG: polysaccharide deacetylase family protein [Parvibaculaceae bacterium]